MTSQIQKGYFLSTVNIDTTERITSVSISYGTPVDPLTPWATSGPVDPAEKGIEVTKFDHDYHPERKGLIFVRGYNPLELNSIIMGNVIPYPASELETIFKDYVPEWNAEHQKRITDPEENTLTPVIQIKIEGLDHILDNIPIPQ